MATSKSKGQKRVSREPAQAPTSRAGKKRPQDQDDPSDTSRRPRKSARIHNSRTSLEENEIGGEQQNDTDELMQKYTELQGE